MQAAKSLPHLWFVGAAEEAAAAKRGAAYKRAFAAQLAVYTGKPPTG